MVVLGVSGLAGWVMSHITDIAPRVGKSLALAALFILGF